MENEVALTKEEKKAMKKEKALKRVWELDFFRGILIIAMIVDHIVFCWSANGLLVRVLQYNGAYPDWFNVVRAYASATWMSYFREYGRYLLMFLLFFISGASSKFSKNNITRALKICLIGAIIFIATWISTKFGSNYIILFGTISCFGVSMLIYALFEHFYKKFFPKGEKAYKWIVLALGIIFTLVGIYFGTIADYIELGGPQHQVAFDAQNFIENGTWKMDGYEYLNYLHPTKLNIEDINASNFWQIIVGRHYTGDDWLGLFPSLGFFFLGAFFGEVMYTKERLAKRESLDRKLNKAFAPINFFGVHSLYFYIFHMPVIWVVCIIPLLCMGWHF